MQNTKKKKSKMNCEKIFFICAGFLIRKPQSCLEAKIVTSVNEWYFVTHLFFPVLVSSTKFKLLNTFFLGTPEILWIKETENLI